MAPKSEENIMKIADIWVRTSTKKHKEIKDETIRKIQDIYKVIINPKHIHINPGFKHKNFWHHQVWFPVIEV